MIRALRLTDVLAYVAFRKHAALNEALLQPEDAPSSPSLRSGFLGRSFELGRQSWVHLDRGQLDGLVAARPRMGGDVWDIDQLIVLPSITEASTVYRELLGHLVVAARDAGVQKVFLRVRSDSPAQLAARRVGLVEYTRESVYRMPNFMPQMADRAPFRPRRRVHHYAIFQLYSAAVPCQVRELEGMTLHEWRLSDGWGFRPTDLHVRLSPRRRDFVLERDGKVVVWSHVDVRARRLRLLAHAAEPAEVLRAALRHGLAQLHTAGAVTCAVRVYQPLLGALLEEEGFALWAEHSLLGQSLAIRVPQRQFVPARA